jgi:hypothetical protein
MHPKRRGALDLRSTPIDAGNAATEHLRKMAAAWRSGRWIGCVKRHSHKGKQEIRHNLLRPISPPRQERNAFIKLLFSFDCPRGWKTEIFHYKPGGTPEFPRVPGYKYQPRF